MLELGDAKLLESELERLWAQGYRWRHVYSQCVVRSALASIRHRRLYDPGFCARTLRSTLPIVVSGSFRFMSVAASLGSRRFNTSIRFNEDWGEG